MTSARGIHSGYPFNRLIVRSSYPKPLKKSSRKKTTFKLFQGIFSTNPFDEQIIIKIFVQKIYKEIWL